jgi:O-antigen ligase
MTHTAAIGGAIADEPEGAGRRPLVFKPPQATLRSRLETGLDFWRAALVYIAVVLTPVIAYVGNLGFAAMVALIGIGALVFLGRKAQPSIGVGILLALLLWGLFSMSWSPAMPVHPDFHRYKVVQALTGAKLVLELGLYSAFVVALSKVSEATAARASLVLAAGLAALSVLLVVEALDGAALYQWIKAAAHQKTRPDLAARNVARGCYVAAVLFWPVALRLRRAHQPLLLTAFIGGLAVSAVIFKVDSPLLALLLAAAVFAAVQAFGRGAIWALLVAVVIYFASAPLVAHFATSLLHPNAVAGGIAKQSWSVRLDIWRFASAEIMQNPLRGWGHSPAPPRRGAAAVAGAGRGRRGPGGPVLGLAVLAHRDHGGGGPQHGRRRRCDRRRLSDHWRSQLRRLARMVAGGGSCGHRGLQPGGRQPSLPGQ